MESKESDFRIPFPVYVVLYILALAAIVLVVKRLVPTRTAKPEIAAVVESKIDTAISEATSAQGKRRIDSLLLSISDDSKDWRERVEAVREVVAIPEINDPETLAQLYAILRRHPEGRPDDWFVVANEIMEQFRLLGVDPETYTAELIRCAQDGEVPEVTRDYAIQHLTLWIASPDPDVAMEPDQEKRDETFHEILAMIQEEENLELDMVGTSLSALHFAMGSSEFAKPTEAREALESVVLRIASGNIVTSKTNRMTALQVGAEMNLPEISMICREVLTDERMSNTTEIEIDANGFTQSDLKLSAVAALGLVGSENDLPLLESIKGSEQALSYAASAAINRISQK
ncbi:MAG: hypothetical protein AAF558_00080 [Verrucomicrobiota bacterium]